jgi:acyl-coenzyme A synthetase/AMP-(fatty) acid ligase
LAVFPAIDDLTARGRSLGRGRPAILEGDRAITYGALTDGILAVSEGFALAGYRPGHRVAFRLPTGARLLVAMLGAIKAGLMVTLFPQNFGSAALELCIRDFDPDCVVDDPDAPLPIGPPARLPRSAPGMIVLWTSGSSGVPRGLVFEVGGLLWNAASNAVVLGLRSDDRSLVYLDGAYCYALVHQILSHLIVGASVVFPEQPPWLARVGGDIERWKATTLAVVPSMLAAILRAPALREKLASLRVLTVGGGAVGETLLGEAAASVGGNLYVTYGLTEAGPRVCTRLFEAGRTPSPRSVGHPMPGVEVELDGEGELCVRTPSARVGCMQAGKLSPLAPLIRTGDFAAIQGDGTVRILGRKGRVINRGGLKIAPAEIETVLRVHPRVIDARVVGVFHRRLGEVPKAYVLASSPSPPVSELSRLCLEQLGHQRVPATIEFVPGLPPQASPWKDVPV